MNRTSFIVRALPLAAALAAGLATAPARATNGYFPHGYGIKAMGMGGAAVAMAEDSMGGANNPASMVWAGSRMDMGLNLFSPHRDASRTGGAPGMNGSVTSDSTNFLVPELGYNRLLRQDLSLGLTVYGNGGMNTDYPQGPFQCPTGPTTAAPANMLCGGGSLGVDLMQLIVAPTVAYKLNARHSVGVSLLLGYQQFKASGLQAFQGFPNFSSAPGSVSNNGYARSHGVGLRLGYMGRLSDMVTIGAAYAPKMNMSAFDKYKGLFAGAGDFDIPEHYALGVSISPTPALTVALDYERINYSGVPSVGHPSLPQGQLGASNGPGFGWKDVNVLKIGVQWRASPAWTLRAGYNHGENPISAADVTFNILAPGVMTKHYTAGFGWTMNPANEINAALMVAPRQSVSGSSLFNRMLGPGAGGTETISMRQHSIGVSWSHKF